MQYTVDVHKALPNMVAGDKVQNDNVTNSIVNQISQLDAHVARKYGILYTVSIQCCKLIYGLVRRGLKIKYRMHRPSI